MIRSIFVAFCLAVGVGLWIASGNFGEDQVSAQVQKPAAELETEVKAPTVRTRKLTIGTFEDSLRLSATTALDSRTRISSQATGQITSVRFKKGERIKKGQLLAVVEQESQETNLAQAQANLDEAQADYNGKKKLASRGFVSKNAVLRAQTSLRSAQAAVRSASRASEKLEIRATASGKVDEKLIENGQFVSTGTPVAEVVQSTNVKFIAEASERDIAKINIGDQVNAQTIAGSLYDGTVAYIASVANAATRTFKIEVTAPNADGKAIEGMTASLEFRLNPKDAHLVPNSLLTLSESGEIGVKIVEDGEVVFIPINLLNSSDQGIWIEGLPDEIELITVGQEFVKGGQRVKTQDEMALAEEVEAAKAELAEKAE